MSADDPRESKERGAGDRRRGDVFGISALASALLSGLAGEKLSQSLDSGGWISVVGFSLTFLFALIWAVYNAPAALLKFRRWRAGTTGVREVSELHAAAEEAEQWSVSLGSDAAGTAAAEWFEQNEPRLRAVLLAEKPQVGTADDVARICDALDTWYVRRREPFVLLELSDFLSAVGEGCNRRDLVELAAVRAATAYRMMGDAEAATTWLGTSENVAPSRRSRTAAALATRRQVERALLHLERAAAVPAGSDRDEAVLNARDRLDDARMSRPGPDLAADVAISINLAIVHLYQQDPDGALEHLRPAAARANAARDRSAEAHALELTGVAAWMLENPLGAESWWRHAEHLYAEIDEREGRARCLQHLGSAAVVAGRLDDALALLRQSAELRSHESALLTEYLTAATTATLPDRTPDPPRHPRRSRLRALLDRWLPR